MHNRLKKWIRTKELRENKLARMDSKGAGDLQSREEMKRDAR